MVVTRGVGKRPNLDLLEEIRGSIVGITIVNARWLVDRESKLVVSVPQQRIEVDAVEVGTLLERTMST